MKTRTKILLPLVLAFLGYCATSRATITNASWTDDGDGAIVCSWWQFNLNASTLKMTGNEYMAGAAHMIGTVQTTDPTDPTLYLGSAVDNDTGFAWTSYQVNVYMSAPFTIVSGTPYVDNVPAGDWSVSPTTYQSSSEFPTEPYEATIDLTGGTPVQIGGELDFGYAIHFGSSTDYAFTQEMIPVPEPGDLGLASALLFGGIELVKRLRKKS
jgi:hypothetical protein